MKEYWNKRLRKYGHTGWANATLYAYDQEARKSAVNQVIGKELGVNDLALDFGAGVGDFSVLLSDVFKKVIAFDISDQAIKIAKANHSNKNIEFVTGNSILEVPLPDNSLDMILSVTVLGHIMDNIMMKKHLDFFIKKMKVNGKLIAVEYAPNQMNYQDTLYQKFRNFMDWEKLFSDNGFFMSKIYACYLPTSQPSLGYLKYKKKMRIKIANFLQRYININFFRLTSIAKEIIVDHDELISTDNAKDYDMKIMVLQKI